MAECPNVRRLRDLRATLGGDGRSQMCAVIDACIDEFEHWHRHAEGMESRTGKHASPPCGNTYAIAARDSDAITVSCERPPNHVGAHTYTYTVNRRTARVEW